MKYIIKISLVVMILTALSFTKAPENSLCGTYGVSKNDPADIKLTLNENHTFNYQDFSNPSDKINASGSWKLKGRYVILTNAEGRRSFHYKWKISQNGMVAKSRKGMCFYSLNKCDSE